MFIWPAVGVDLPGTACILAPLASMAIFSLLDALLARLGYTLAHKMSLG